MSLKRFAVLALLALGASKATAQDVLVASPVWQVPKDAPDELPKLKEKPKLSFPDELKATPDIGYVIFQVLLDPKGKTLGLHPRGTLAIFERAVATAGWSWEGGRREGKGVNTETSFAVIFNPASAAEKSSEATPRLLQVSLVVVDSPKSAKGQIAIPDRRETAEVSVDEQGFVSTVKHVPAGLEGALTVAVKNWRFMPARRGGQPVAADVRVPIIVVSRDAISIKREGKLVQPVVTKQTRPHYPFGMIENGMRGEVLVDFIVDIEGRVRNAFVVRSLNPSFDDPALDAVNQWRFEPGRVGGNPVNTHMQVPIFFSLDETGEGGRGPLTTPKKPDLSKLPEQFRYDTAPRPTGTVRPVYPYALLRANKDGKAMVRFVVDTKGRVVQADIGESTTPELGRALRAAIECFTYEPALKGGRPSLALQGFAQQFSRDEKWQLVGDDDLALLRREEKKPETILKLNELDAKLVARSRRAPQFPLSVKEDVTSGETLIEFLIDEEGRARLPRIVSASDEAFGYAAVQAVSSWRFEPPTRGGRAVVVRVQIPITFGAPAKSSEKK
jgi:TonB family protein